MILAAPLVIPFAEAVGISIATLGMAKAADMVNDYIQENPEQSMKILSTIVPGVGIGEIFMKKGKDEEVEEEVEVEDVDARDLTRAEKAKEMKRRFKEGTGDKREIGKKGYEEIILPGKEDEMLDEAEDRYDGGLEEVSKPKFDYKKFFKKRYADGGAIGIEVLFEEKKPRKNFNQGGYEPLFTEEVETFTAPIGLNTTTVPSRIGKTYTDATNEAFRIGNIANKTGLTNPESIMKMSEMPMAVRTLSGINRMDPSSNLIADKYKKQGLSSDYRHTLGTSAFKDSIIDYLGSNLGIDKQSGILDTVGSLTAKGATVFEEGKDAISSLKQYYKDNKRLGEKSPELFNLKLSEILAQPIEDYEANFFAADQIPFGTSPLKKMEMIQAYRKFGKNNYMQQLENQKKTAMQEQIKKAEAAAKAEAARAAQYGATNYGRGSDGQQSYSNMGTQGFGVGATTGGPVSNRTGRGRTGYDDGGRVGLFMGGDPLTGQALSIYNSMNAYGFDDQAIADALAAQGLYTAPGSSTPETTTPNIINQQLQTGGGGDNNFGGQGIGAFGNLDPNTKQTMQVEVADGMGGVEIKEVDTYLDAGGMRKTLDNKNPVNAGIDVKPMAVTIMEALMGKKNDSEFDPEGKIYGTFNNPNYKDLSFFGKIKADYSRQKELKQLQKEFELQEKLKKQIAKEEADRAAQYGATNYGQGAGGQSYSNMGTQGFGVAAGGMGGPVSNKTGSGRTDYNDGGRVYLYNRLK